MRTMIVIVEEEVRKIGCPMIAGLIGASISPLAGDGLDEAFGLSVGLRAIGLSEEMFDAELAAGGGEVAGAVGGAAIGENALDADAMSFEESDGLVESLEDAVDLLVWEEAGKGEAGVVVDGDVEAFDAGARIAEGAIAGGADAGPREAAQFLDVEMKEFARVSTLVTLWRRFGRLEGGEAMEAVAAHDPGDGGLGDLKNGEGSGRRSGAGGAERGCELRVWSWSCGAEGSGWRSDREAEVESRILWRAQASGGRSVR